MVQWVHQNIASHKGNPARVFIWSQSAGNVPASTYVAHSEFWGPQGIGLKGAIFMSAPAGHCLEYMVFKNHGHISEVTSPNTANDSVTGPILKWMKSVK